MKKKNLLGALLVIIILGFISLLAYLIVTSNNIRLGLKKAEIAKILGYKCGNLNTGGVKFEFDKPQKKTVEIFYCSKYRTNYNLEDLNKLDKQEKEDTFKKVLVLCFENDKLIEWGYGRIGFMEIMKKYPEIYDLLKSGDSLGFADPSAIPKFRLKLDQ